MIHNGLMRVWFQIDHPRLRIRAEGCAANPEAALNRARRDDPCWNEVDLSQVHWGYTTSHTEHIAFVAIPRERTPSVYGVYDFEHIRKCLEEIRKERPADNSPQEWSAISDPSMWQMP